ncbi:MAG: DUF6110 family protein [Lachnoclostridium edouardi]|uniref:DUF6110 family protein n=1 Tax=Lachnoclostridium edouardi TaxID=1926283 RepID=UPI0026DBA722|nr:DUF6110 family protein [Lachnoclostridium edouardi]MDO4278009.1 DUF6110 family protein [Lachnoclostridium edouardi]
MMDIFKLKRLGIFAGGVLFGTAGIKVLASKDAKKFYINCLAAGLRAKDCVMTTATNIQENAEDILAEAKGINSQRCQEVFEDQSSEEDQCCQSETEE